jgi:hypothetical protein
MRIFMAVDGGDPLLEPLIAVSARIFIAVDGEPLEPLLAVSAVQPLNHSLHHIQPSALASEIRSTAL